MIQTYAHRHKDLQIKYNALHEEVDEQIRNAAKAFLDVVNVPSFLIDLGLDSVFVGDFDSSLGRCRLMDAILLRDEKVFVRIEPNDGFLPLTKFETLHVRDKLNILEAVASRLDEFI